MKDEIRPMFYCKICREWVPEERKHKKKRHTLK